MDSIIAWIKGVYKRITESAEKLLDTLVHFFEWAQDAYDDFWNTFKVFPEWVFSRMAEEIVRFFNKLPVPSFFDTAGDAFAGIPPSVVYFASAFRIGEGISMILLALLLRFIIRRIPIIG